LKQKDNEIPQHARAVETTCVNNHIADAGSFGPLPNKQTIAIIKRARGNSKPGKTIHNPIKF